MATRTVATVFGGSGFIGRYVVQRLAAAGYVVRVAVRDTVGAQFLRTAGQVGQVEPIYAPITQAGPVACAVQDASVVVNLVGILSERRAGDFQRVHADAAGAMAQAATAAGVLRLVHVSAIGADPASASAYGRTKAAGEAAVRAAFSGAAILRPSVVFGAEDQFFNRIGRVAQISPVMPVISGATRMQPVYVGDVADAIMAGLARDEAAGGLFELGGPDVLRFRDILAYVLKVTQRQRRLIAIPLRLARLQAAFAERLPGKPFTRDQLALLGHDNVVAPGAAGLEALGITPTPIALIVPEYLDQYRPGGGKKPLPWQHQIVPDRPQ
jgi:NADH dehydrogenase